MFLIPLLCLTLSFYASATDLGYSCYKDNVYDILFLVKTSPPLVNQKTWDVNNDMNGVFYSACKDFYEIKIGYLQEAFMYEPENVIYFGFPGHDDKLTRISNMLGLQFQVIGDAVETVKNVTCKTTNTSELVCDRNKIVNLISPSIERNFGDYNVYDLIQNMIGNNDSRTVTHGRSCAPVFQKTQDLKTVVLCLERHTDINVNIFPLNLIVTGLERCKSTLENYDYSVLALLTSKGFVDSKERKDSSVHIVPTVLFNTPYVSEEDEALFPNSVNLLPWRLLKFGFLGFLRSVGWERVVIASGVSHYSIEFEHELTTLFDKEGIVYTSVKSEDPVFDIVEMTNKLVMVSPRVVIVNLEETRALNLIKRWGNRPIIWIVRDIRVHKDHTYNQPLPPHLFSIYLGAVTESSDCNVDANILAGLSTIAHAYRRTTYQDLTLGRRMFYKQLYNKIKEIVEEQTEAMAFVYKLSNGRTGRQWMSELVSTMRVDNNGAKVLSFTNPYKSGKPSDGTSQCLAKSNKYSEPCEDIFVLLLMCVVVLFLTTSLMISCYFHKTSPFHDPRYHNF